MNQRVLSAMLACTALALAACSNKPEPEAVVVAATASTPAPIEHPPVTEIASALLLKSTHASFHAHLPCNDCVGIDIHLNLQRDQMGDNSYVMRSVHKHRDNTPSISSGSWTITPLKQGDADIAVLELDSGRPAGLTHFRVDNDGSLNLLDSLDHSLDSSSPVILQGDGGDLDLHELYEEQELGTAG